MNAEVPLVDGVILPAVEVGNGKVNLKSVGEKRKAAIAKKKKRRSTRAGKESPRRNEGHPVGRGRVAGAANPAQGIRLVPGKAMVTQVTAAVAMDAAVEILLPMIRGMTRSVRRNVIRKSTAEAQANTEESEVGLLEAEVGADQGVEVETECGFKQ